MTDTFNTEIDVGPPPVTLRKRRSFGAIGIIALVLILGAGAGLLWLNSDTLADMTHSLSGNNSNAAVLASAPDSVSASDFATFQQQTGSSMLAATDLLTAQQAELKRLSDQIQGLTTQVAGLTSKIDQMQGRGPALQAPLAQVPTAAAPPPAMAATAPRPAPTAARKRPADKPAGAISVGGAPLPSQSAR